MRGATQRGGPLKSDAARTVTPGPHHESRAKGFPHRTEGFWHGSTEMSRHIAKPDHTGRTLGDMTEGRSEAEGHRRLHTRTHRRDSLSERDQVHGLARTLFVCDAPPLGRRPEHRIDRLTPIRPQMGRLLEHGVSANGLTRCMQAHSAPPGRSVPTAEPSRCITLQQQGSNASIHTDNGDDNDRGQDNS
jgi:hypothetical protein